MEIQRRGVYDFPVIIIYDHEFLVKHTFYDVTPSTISMIAEGILQVNTYEFYKIVVNQPMGTHTIFIDAPTYRKSMKEGLTK